MTTFHQHLPANTVGRDFIVGDLHGCLDLLEAELARIKFEPTKDRLFSVGDLADRGPDSMGCLRLLREPWFYAVRGNHEDMLIAYIYPAARPYAFDNPGKVFFQNGGRWVLDLDAATEKELMHDLLPRVVALPYVITVGEEASQFHIAHAELMTGRIEEGEIWSSLAGLPVDQTPRRVLTDELLTDEVLSAMVEPLTWGRRLVGQVKVKECAEIETPAGKLLVSQQPMRPGLSLTYVGHTPLTYMVLHQSHLFVDRGAYAREPGTCLLVLCHDDVRARLQ